MILFDILGNKSFKTINYPRKNPLSLSLAVTNKCNSRCRTCNIWNKEENDQELTIDEYGKIFRNFKRPPLELILTGGEPFIREDIAEICQMAIEHLRPKIIIIPSNGILTKKIVSDIEKILRNSFKTKIVINISLDGIRKDNDEIRGLEGSFDRAIDTYLAVRGIQNESLNLKIHTVVSSYNVDKIPEIYEYIREILKTNLYIVEIAQERFELDNCDKGEEIVPSLEKYSRAIGFLSKRLEKEKFSGLSKIIQASRLEYYLLSKRILEGKRRIIPCYAGFASGQITPSGDVHFCATKKSTLGNLRKSNYNFEKVWFSEKASEARRESKKNDCYCPLANVAYINMLHNFNSLLKIFIRLGKDFLKLHGNE
jgi:MoaA/NifB/PqqE/SkfB family radical SAM enzyme